MTLHRLLLVQFVASVLFLTFPKTSLAFSIKNPVENLLENVLKRGAPAKEASPPSADQGKALLNKLDIQSNTEPRPFNAELSQLPALLTASMPVRFSFLLLSVLLQHKTHYRITTRTIILGCVETRNWCLL